MYKSGININTIKEVLGHVRIDTTEIYTHLHDKDVMKAIQGHPLSKFKIADALTYCAVAVWLEDICKNQILILIWIIFNL